MTYDHFIDVLTGYQTSHVKALAFPNSCAPKRIPSAFALLLSDVVALLEQHSAQLCPTNQVIALFGLQPSSVALTSDYPLLLNRVLNKQHPNVHLCCSLAYLKTPKDQLSQIESWQGAQNLIIDFTTGIVMDGLCYLSQIFSEPKKGIVYGILNSVKLAKVWAIVNHHIQRTTRARSLASSR
jgi:hypothetical protein